jgi:hypothetical protein
MIGSVSPVSRVTNSDMTYIHILHFASVQSVDVDHLSLLVIGECGTIVE